MSDGLFDELPEHGASAPALPRPRRERWQPLRSGLLNIFKYDEEEFAFEDGRLLLRGNNGAGKSRILALQLPFLLDGEMASHRVEPDGDQAKRMEWNLLMSNHENRLGYTWIEFARRDAEGVEHYLTLGCGMHARKGVGIPPHARWFFVTRQRIGATLRLMSENRVPLNRERLEAALGAEGAIYRSARDYRKAVDDALFGLGVRYEPLIDLLLQLRKPQIMRDFKADDLSRLLSEALPPLSPRLIENVSVSFRSLESDRQQLLELTDARRSVETFLKSYQHYVRIAVRRRAADVRATHRLLEEAHRKLRLRAEQLAENAEAIASGEAAERQLAEQLAAARETERTLLASPEMKSAETLRNAAATRDERARQSDQANGRALQDGERHAQSRREREEADARVARQDKEVAVLHASLAEAGQAASMPEAAFAKGEIAAAGDVAAARKSFEKATAERVRQIALVRERNTALAKCIQAREREQTRFEDRRDDVVRCEEEETRCREERAGALGEIATRMYAWEATLEVLPLSEGEDWLALFDAWTLDASAPSVARIDAASVIASHALADERSRLAHAQQEQRGARAALLTELQALREGGQPTPIAPHTREAEFRASAPGAPLWKLCDFREEISAEARAGFESALEAAGFLDAWIMPDGSFIDPATQDVFFTAPHGAPDAGLNRILRVEIDPADTSAAAIAPSLVQRLLGCIGATDQEGETWMAADGRWRHGLLRGAWMKPEAEYLGHAARENARRRRIAAMEATLAEIDEALAALAQDQETLAARAAKLQAERESAPSTEPLRRAMHVLESAETASAGARARLEEVDQTLAKAREAERGAREVRDCDAADLGLAAWAEPAALQELEGLVARLREKAAALWPAWDALLAARAAQAAASAREDAAREASEHANARAEEARQSAAEAVAHFEALHASVGSTADEVLARLDAAKIARAGFEEEEKRTRAILEHLRIARARLETEAQRVEEDRAAHEESREAAAKRLQLFAEKRLLEEAGDDLQPERVELSAHRAVELARRIEQALESIPADEDAWTRVKSGIQQQFSELNDQLGMRGYHPQAEIVDEGVFAITCAFQGQARTMTALRQSLSDEMQSRDQMLDAREREVIENHLIGEVATELQTLIRAGEDWVRIVNDELDQRPASSGIKLCFTWEVDAEASDGLDAARRQLLQMTAAWSTAERDSIGRFLQGRINAERTADETAPWQEHLRRALDYRAWHRFGILRFQDGQWKKLTKQTYGTGSGGEKALTLTLPQFAAAAAHYRSAAPYAPRLILLDEVFIGIDAPTRERLMGLLASFDLDFVMTSEREWGCYKTLPALAICQLASRPDSPAVHVTRWVWNGRQLLPSTDAAPA